MSYVTPQLRAPRHPKYDAIHRALLTGLLSNIGTKSDTYEYLGARGIRFNIFPGSALFAEKPKWLVAAELVETTKLYARTCATIQPLWIEQIGRHLTERTYSEPHWDPKTQSVVAYERVMLYGLVLIAQRRVHYGPINPRISREIFIHNALVLETLRTDAAFFRFNRDLTEEVRGLEAKVRARNLLADVATRYAFYDARIPADITNAVQFESFRKRVERENPRTLFMNKADLLRADAPEITPTNFPDRVETFGMKLPLDYKYEPGEPNDGITLTVPLAALPQLRAERYEWLVPGMLEEKIAALIKSLPGALRRNFVPVPDHAKAAAAALAESVGPAGGGGVSDESLLEALAKHLRKMTGAEVDAASFHPETLPDYLKMAYRVVDDTGRTVVLSRDLPDTQKKLATHAAHAFARIPQQEFNRDNITSWDFGDLPEVVRVQRFKMTIDAYPALVVTGPVGEVKGEEGRRHSGLALRLFPSGEAALAEHRAGLRRLFMVMQRRELKYALAYVPDLARMGLEFLALGTAEEFRRQLTELIVDRALLADGKLIRTAAAWDERRQEAAINLLDTTDAVTVLVGEILELHHQLTLRMEDVTSYWRASAADVHDQLAYLVGKDFLVQTPWTWLEHFPRYLRGIFSRLDKLANGNVERDVTRMNEIAPWQRMHRDRAARQRAAGGSGHDPELELFRWMLEEFRIHLFAQELHTPFPISVRRLEKQWEKVRA